MWRIRSPYKQSWRQGYETLAHVSFSPSVFSVTSMCGPSMPWDLEVMESSFSACVSPSKWKGRMCQRDIEINQNCTLVLIFKESAFKHREIDNSKHICVTSCNSKHHEMLGRAWKQGPSTMTLGVLRLWSSRKGLVMPVACHPLHSFRDCPAAWLIDLVFGWRKDRYTDTGPQKLGSGRLV